MLDTCTTPHWWLPSLVWTGPNGWKGIGYNPKVVNGVLFALDVTGVNWVLLRPSSFCKDDELLHYKYATLDPWHCSVGVFLNAFFYFPSFSLAAWAALIWSIFGRILSRQGREELRIREKKSRAYLKRHSRHSTCSFVAVASYVFHQPRLDVTVPPFHRKSPPSISYRLFYISMVWKLS